MKDFGSEILNLITEYFAPEDVFSEASLKIWAEENGFISREDHDAEIAALEDQLENQ